MLVLSNSKLWDRLRCYQPGDGTSLFSKRLARENSWSNSFARRVIEEYRKFAYLACISDVPVTPSDEIDQVWHLHLTYTRSYWSEFCQTVLEKDLHHEPTRGGRREANKFERWYGHTLDLYRQEFGCEPPADIWPCSKVRFSRPVHMKRVDLSRHWLLPRPKPGLLKVAGVAAVSAVLSGCTVSLFGAPFEVYAWQVALVVFFVLWAIAYFLVPYVDKAGPPSSEKKDKDNAAGGGGDCGTDDSSGCGSGCGGGGD